MQGAEGSLKADDWFIRLVQVGSDTEKIFTIRQLLAESVWDVSINALGPPDGRGVGGGLTGPLVEGGIIIGRKNNSTQLLENTSGEFASPIISRTHAQLTITPNGHVYMTDLASLHGTFVATDEYLTGCKRLEPYTPMQLLHGDVITLGKAITANGKAHDAIRLRVVFKHPFFGQSSSASGRTELRRTTSLLARGKFAETTGLERLLGRMERKLLTERGSTGVVGGEDIETQGTRETSSDSIKLLDTPTHIEEEDEHKSSGGYRIPSSVMYQSEGEEEALPRGATEVITVFDDDEDEEGPEVMSVHPQVTDTRSETPDSVIVTMPPSAQKPVLEPITSYALPREQVAAAIVDDKDPEENVGVRATVEVQEIEVASDQEGSVAAHSDERPMDVDVDYEDVPEQDEDVDFDEDEDYDEDSEDAYSYDVDDDPRSIASHDYGNYTPRTDDLSDYSEDDSDYPHFEENRPKDSSPPISAGRLMTPTSLEVAGDPAQCVPSSQIPKEEPISPVVFEAWPRVEPEAEDDEERDPSYGQWYSYSSDGGDDRHVDAQEEDEDNGDYNKDGDDGDDASMSEEYSDESDVHSEYEAAAGEDEEESERERGAEDGEEEKQGMSEDEDEGEVAVKQERIASEVADAPMAHLEELPAHVQPTSRRSSPDKASRHSTPYHAVSYQHHHDVFEADQIVLRALDRDEKRRQAALLARQKYSDTQRRDQRGVTGLEELSESRTDIVALPEPAVEHTPTAAQEKGDAPPEQDDRPSSQPETSIEEKDEEPKARQRKRPMTATQFRAHRLAQEAKRLGTQASVLAQQQDTSIQTDPVDVPVTPPNDQRPRTPSISDASSVGPVTPPSSTVTLGRGVKRSAPDDADEPVIVPADTSALVPADSPRPAKLRKVASTIGWMALGAVAGSIGTIAGLMQLSE